MLDLCYFPSAGTDDKVEITLFRINMYDFKCGCVLFFYRNWRKIVDVGCDMASYQQLSGPQQRNGNNLEQIYYSGKYPLPPH